MNLEENNSTQEKDKIPIVKKDEQPKFLINSEQDQPPWEDFEETNVDENFKRKAPSEKQISEMNQEMIELGDTFAGAKFNWHLDGALNISFMNSVDAKKKIDYIGYHKDVDVSVEKSELAELEKHLLKKGYGLFTSSGRIYELIANQPEFKASGEHAKILLRRLAEKVEKDGDGSIDAMTKCGMELFCVNKNNDAKRQKIYAVKKLIEDFEKIKAIKNKL